MKFPGPGTYPTLNSISQKGFQFLSKWRSSLASVFHPPRSARFSGTPKHIRLVPGPGHYDMKPSLNPTGSYFLSKFKSSFVRRFGFEKRDSLTRGSVLWTPGPGSYRSPSEFGIYRAQDKYIKETQRNEQLKSSSSPNRLLSKSSSQPTLVVKK
jgi:hypothetical protein